MEKKEKGMIWKKMKMANVIGLVYMLSITYVVWMLFHVEIPNSNRDILNTCLFAYFSLGLGGVVYYFFGFRKNGKEENIDPLGEKCTICGKYEYTINKTVGGSNPAGDPDDE